MAWSGTSSERTPEELKMKKAKRSRILDQSGQGLTEYITLLLLVSIFSIAAAQTLGKKIKDKIELATRHIESGITLEERK
jgi:Flp pilus assembly pilin Flp